MTKHNILYGFIGLLVGLIIGFLFANSVNQNGGGAARTQPPAQPRSNASANNNSPANSSEELTEEEVREAIATADKKPDDFELQRNLGLALYRYASFTQDARYLPDVERFLKRAYDADPKDRDLTVALGHVVFDMAQQTDAARFADARTYYQKALQMKPDDADVRTDLGLTYYLAKPSDPQKAIAEFRQSLAIDARHEATLQHLAAALIVVGNHTEAQKRIEELQAINSSNPALSNLRAQLAQSKNARE